MTVPRLYEGKPSAKLRPKKKSQNDFQSISRKIWDDTGKQPLHKSQIHLLRKPDGSEEVGDQASENQTRKSKDNSAASFSFLQKNSADQDQKEKSDQISSGRSGKLTDASGKSGKNRERNK